MLALLPASLVDEIKDRYATLGEKYLTDEYTQDGRRINACMTKSSWQDAREEVVDAAFNVLVQIFKDNNNDNLSNEAYSVLENLADIYGLIMVLRFREEDAIS